MRLRGVFWTYNRGLERVEVWIGDPERAGSIGVAKCNIEKFWHEDKRIQAEKLANWADRLGQALIFNGYGGPQSPDLGECYSCGGEWDDQKCSQSKRPCGHHCNHCDDGMCHWCGHHFEESE